MKIFAKERKIGYRLVPDAENGLRDAEKAASLKLQAASKYTSARRKTAISFKAVNKYSAILAREGRDGLRLEA